MAIYTLGGAPVQIVAAEQRRRWWAMFNGRSKVWDKQPTPNQLKGAKEVEEFDIWWVKARQVGAYPDGSGAANIGQLVSSCERKHDGWIPFTEFRANDGIAEIIAECEMKRDDAARAA
jgi:hypothetical protein